MPAFFLGVKLHIWYHMMNMIIFRRYSIKQFAAVAVLLVSVLAPLEVFAIGLSPPEVELGHIPVGKSHTVSAQISRAPNEMGGSLRVSVTPRKSAAGFFFGEPSFIIPSGTREFNYLFSVIPDYVQSEFQELYVTFLVEQETTVSSGVSVKTGVTQVVRFTTEVDSSSEPLTQLTVTPILGGVSAGAVCEAFRIDTGAVLGSGTTSTNGTCTIVLPRSYKGVVVVRVKGGPGVKYFDERTGTLADFTAEQAVLSAVAPSVWNTPSAIVSTPVTTLTTMVASKAGIEPSATSTSFRAPEITTASLSQAIVDTLPILGLSARDINIYETPPASAFFQTADVGTGKKLSGSAEQLNYGVALTAVANIAPVEVSLGDFANTLANSVKENNVSVAVPEIARFKQVFQSVVGTVVDNSAGTVVVPAIPATIPDSPTGLSVSNADGRAVFIFTAPVNNGGTAVSLYTVACDSQSGVSVSGSGTDSPISVTGLKNGVEYSCTVRAKNTVGSSAPTQIVSAKPLTASIGNISGGVGGVSRPTELGRGYIQPRAKTESDVKTSPSATQKPPIFKTEPDRAEMSVGEAPSVARGRDTGGRKESATEDGREATITYGPKHPLPASRSLAERPSVSREPLEVSESVVSDSSVVRPGLSAFIQSPTHPSEDKYVSNNNATFFLREQGVGKDQPVRFLIDNKPSANSNELIHETNNPSVSFNLSDGIYYVHTQDAGSESGEIASRRVMIDTTPPSVEIKLQPIKRLPLFSPKPAIKLDALDALAGVSDIQASVNGTPVNIDDRRISLRKMGFGTHALTVQATDLAGNSVDKSFVIDVSPKYPVAKIVSRVLGFFAGRAFSLFNR